MQPTSPQPDPQEQIVDLDKVPVHTPANCQHDYRPDPTDETDDFVAMVCAKNCGHGFLKRKRIDAAS